MKVLLLAFLLGMQVAIEPPEYPKGWYCTPAGTVKSGRRTSEHPCHCKRMDHDALCEGTVMQEDPVCAQYCHPLHCGCPVMCVPPSKE